MTGTRRVIGVGAGLFLFTFAIYWALGPKQTAFDYQLSQANNIIHGHLDLTAEYTHNLGVLERVLYDGVGFCLPLDDPRGPGPATQIENPRITAGCKTYMQHSLGPAFLLVPLALIWGLDVDQTLVSVLLAALIAPLVYAIARRFSDSLRTQLALTVMVMFGTILWWVGANGGVWFFAHTTAVLFLFGAIYATVGLRNPLLAGALIGAAFLCRPTTILGGLFPLVAFSDQWLRPDPEGGNPFRRFRITPLVKLALGVAPFIVVAMAVNELRFNNPFESGYSYTEQYYQTGLRSVFDHGLFDVSYIPRHVAVFWEQMPIFADHGSYVWPSWFGLAAWVTTPPLFYALFVHLKRIRPVALLGAGALALACAFLLMDAIRRGLGSDSGTAGIALGIHLWPFWLTIAGAVGAAILSRDRLVVACWAAILPIALADSLFAATGWAQFGYRYGLDFMPFLVLLVVIAVAPRVRRRHLALVALAVLVNLWGVLWIYTLDPARLWGWTWVSF